MLEKNQIITGKVTNVTKFGAFVKIDNTNPPITGYVHVSQVDTCYVKDIAQHIAIGDDITAIVTECKPDGKYELSIKQHKLTTQRVNRSDEPKDGFEDKMKLFMKKSEEKQVEVKRNIRRKQKDEKKKKR